MTISPQSLPAYIENHIDHTWYKTSCGAL